MLLEKDGNIYEYNDTLKASNGLFDTPYGAVINKTANEGVAYKKQSEVKELGSVIIVSFHNLTT